MEPTADIGSGVPCGLVPIPYCDAKDRAENCEPAEVGLLARPSMGPKLPDLECAALLSLPPLADCPVWMVTTGREGCSHGVMVLPIGVARCNVGSCGRPGAAAPAPPTGFTLGDGGIASPNLGVRAPPGLPPPRAGRSKGAGEDMVGMGFGDCCEATTGASGEVLLEGFMAKKRVSFYYVTRKVEYCAFRVHPIRGANGLTTNKD